MGGFTEKDARRIKEVVRRVEAMPLSVEGPGIHPRLPTPIRNAFTTSTVTARTGNIKGFGTATLYVDDGLGTGNMVQMQTGVRVWNPFGSSVASSKWVVVTIVDGMYQLVSADC